MISARPPFGSMNGHRRGAFLVTTVPGNDAYTKLLIQSNTTDGSTTFTDSSASAHTITKAGAVHHETDQYKFGTTSIRFNGSADYLTLADHADWAFGSGDFTIDFWVMQDAGQIARPLCIGYSYIYLAADGSSGLSWYHTDGSTIVGLSWSAIASVDVWRHIALVRTGNTLKVFENGIEKDSDSYTGPFYDNKSGFWIGELNWSAANCTTGYIDEFRVSKGIARWTSNFTPPKGYYV